jgi:hypothetical protein
MRDFPRVHLHGRTYLLDVAASELQNPKHPWDVVPLNEAELEYYKALAGGVA